MKIKPEDWSEPKEKHGYIKFLDILFPFDQKKVLQTDLFQKLTDFRCYLNFNSCHPNYTFSGNVKSQALRLRRIINDSTRLEKRLDDLKADFRKCGYPERMLNNIMQKVKKMERVLEPVKRTEEKEDKVMVVSTFGRDQKLVEATKKIEKLSDKFQFKYVKKTRPSLRNTLVKSKKCSLGNPQGKTKPCLRRNCKACKMVSGANFVTDMTGKKYKSAEGKCSTRNVIYHAQCKLCVKANCYCGKTTQPLNSRISGHRGKFYECLSFDMEEIDDEDHLLGLHLFQKHQITSRDAFSDSYVFTILESCNPRDLDLKEHMWVQKLKCVAPYGLNSHDPFGLPIVL